MFSLKMLASPGEVDFGWRLFKHISNISGSNGSFGSNWMTQLMEEHPLQYWYMSMVISGLPW